jgi:Zn-dependent peptidase ImmA (M78 family)
VKWKSRWPGLQSRARARVSELLERAEPCPPVLLRPLSERAGISRVQFRPILGDGALSIEAGSFVVHVNCAKADIAELERAFYGVEAGGRGIPPRARFTIAHEVAHTLFYTHVDPLGTVVTGRQSRQLHKLESVCNDLAARMLVPERQLEMLLSRETDSTVFFDPDLVMALAWQFAVSPEVAIGRLEPLTERTKVHGAVCAVRKTDGGWMITALAATSGAYKLIPGLAGAWEKSALAGWLDHYMNIEWGGCSGAAAEFPLTDAAAAPHTVIRWVGASGPVEGRVLTIMFD